MEEEKRLAQGLEQTLREAGAALVGFGDLGGICPPPLITGVSVAVPLPPDVLDMVIAQTVKILMARTANSLPEAPFDPARKTCPYCGGKPELSVVHEKEGHRSLFCTDCGRHWRFQRTACPSCGCDKPDNLRLHFAESTPDERAVSCKNCGHYILEADIRKRDLALDGAAIVCLGMGYLDALMQEQGLLPLGESV